MLASLLSSHRIHIYRNFGSAARKNISQRLKINILYLVSVSGESDEPKGQLSWRAPGSDFTEDPCFRQQYF